MCVIAAENDNIAIRGWARIYSRSSVSLCLVAYRQANGIVSRATLGWVKTFQRGRDEFPNQLVQ